MRGQHGERRSRAFVRPTGRATVIAPFTRTLPRPSAHLQHTTIGGRPVIVPSVPQEET